MWGPVPSQRRNRLRCCWTASATRDRVSQPHSSLQQRGMERLPRSNPDSCHLGLGAGSPRKPATPDAFAHAVKPSGLRSEGDDEGKTPAKPVLGFTLTLGPLEPVQGEGYTL